MNPRYVARQRKGADGRWICKVCANPCPKRRKSYCSDECWARNTPSMMRHRVWKRDNGICALCGLDTKTVQCAGKYYGVKHRWEADHIVPVSEGGGLCGLDGYRTLCTGPGTNGCHGKESGRLRKRLNEQRRIEQAQRETGRLF